MIQRLEATLGRAIAAWQDRIHRRPGRVCAWTLGVTLPLALFAAFGLGVNMDNVRLVSPDLPFMQSAADYSRSFDNLDDALLIVVDAETPELARKATRELEGRLSQQRDAFREVFEPAGGTFFERHGLLYRDVDELYEFGDYLAQFQPVISELEREPSISTLSRLLRHGLEASPTAAEGRLRAAWPAVLDRFGQATVSVYDEYPISVSWESLLLEGSALNPVTRRVLVAHPLLQFDSLLAAAPALDSIRGAARDLELTPERGVRVRVTGNPALNYEEMSDIAWDVGVAGILSFALVTLVLRRALLSLRMVAAAAITLLVGLIWTAAFAALAVGRLNLVSIAFGVLFIGLGVDFAIHLGMHYAEALRRGAAPREAARQSANEVGASLVICSVSTSIGFFAFVPTDYRGVAELGLIAGTGMFVILFLTLTLFPALLASWLRVDAAAVGVRAPARFHVLRTLERHPGAICAGAAVAAVCALLVLPGLRFDANVVRMRNPDTESVQAFDDLLATTNTTPWYADAIAPDLTGAVALAAELRNLPEVDRAISLVDYVPADQEEKLDVLADLAMLLDVASPGVPAAEASVDEQVAALRQLHEFLAGESVTASTDAPLAASAGLLRAELGRFLERIERDPDPTEELEELERILLAWFPDHVGRLRTALEPQQVSLEVLPPELRERMLAPDGRARVQVFPAEDLTRSEALTAFADGVRRVAPGATGLPINLVEFGRATSRSLLEATATALLAVAGLLWLLWRRVTPTLLALAPLLLAALLTGAAMVLIDQPFNFANVIVLPLLLGVGVDSGIHLVQRARRVGGRGLVGTTTARAVFYSALTTLASFGSLAFSSHRGIAGMGLMLVVAMLATLACNLLVLPAMIRLSYRQLPPLPVAPPAGGLAAEEPGG